MKVNSWLTKTTDSKSSFINSDDHFSLQRKIGIYLQKRKSTHENCTFPEINFRDLLHSSSEVLLAQKPAKCVSVYFAKKQEQYFFFVVVGFMSALFYLIYIQTKTKLYIHCADAGGKDFCDIVCFLHALETSSS